MIQVAARNLNDDSIFECRIHDLLRDVAIEKAKEDNFLRVCSSLDALRSWGGARRIAVHNLKCNELIKYEISNLRTFLCFNSHISEYSGHGLLKVFSEMSPIYGYSNKSGITKMPFEELSQLRFLELTGSTITWNQRFFKKSISGMKFLQTLNLRYAHSLSSGELPDCIWHIKTLRHVILPLSSFISGPPATTDLPNLQTLCGIKNRESWEYNNLPNLPNLHHLEIKITDEIPWVLIVAFLHTLKKLVKLDITGQDIPIEVIDMKVFTFYPHLTLLTYQGRLPCHAFDVAMFPTHLVYLNLYYSELQQDPLTVLEKMLGLKVLELWNWRASNPKMKCSSRGFPRLRKLEIELLEGLEEWEIEDGAMPMLKHLSVSLCAKLHVPQGLQHLNALTNLTWYFPRNDHQSDQKAKEIHNLCKHVPSVAIEGFDEDSHTTISLISIGS
jgi:hypothetical protein